MNAKRERTVWSLARWSGWVSVTLLVWATAVPAGYAELLDRTLATVGTRIITLSDVRGFLDFGIVEPGAEDPIAGGLQQAIDRALMLDEAERYSITLTRPERVDARLAAIRARFPDQAAFEHALQVNGFTESRLREIVRDDLKIVQYLEQRFGAVPPPTDEEIERYYTAHASEFVRNGTPIPLADVREAIGQRLTAEIRETLIAEWVVSLRRRGEVQPIHEMAGAPAAPVWRPGR